MRSRLTIVLLVLFAVIAAAIMIRPDTASRKYSEAVDEPDADDPIVASSRVAAVDGEARVVLDTAEVRRIGLSTVQLAGASAEVGRRLIGQVISEPERTVTLRAPVAGRLVGAESRRWPSIGERVAAGTTIGRVSDAQPLSVPMGGRVTVVGARPGEIVEAGQVLLQLADDTRPVVRVAWPADAGPARSRLILLPGGDDVRIDATLIGPAPEADPLTRLPAYLYRARARWPGAVPGTPVASLVPTGGRAEGALVPDEAVVQWEGLVWTYLQRAPGTYARVRVPTDRPAPGGWVVGPPLAAGDTVVVTGVQELLSEEFRARVTVGEESGE